MAVYLAMYSSGNYDDYAEYIVFATTDKKKVTKWVTKFNRIHKAYLEMYEPYLTKNKYSFPWIDDQYIDKYFEKWNKVSHVNRAYWKEVETR